MFVNGFTKFLNGIYAQKLAKPLVRWTIGFTAVNDCFTAYNGSRDQIQKCFSDSKESENVIKPTERLLTIDKKTILVYRNFFSGFASKPISAINIGMNKLYGFKARPDQTSNS